MSRFAFGLIAILITSSAFAAPQYTVTNLTEAFYTDYDGSVAIDRFEINCMNNVGQFAGVCTTTGGIQDAFLWEPGLAPTWFGLNMPTSKLLKVCDMNDSGQIAGDYMPNEQAGCAFHWEANSGILPLSDTKHIYCTQTKEINASGDVVFAGWETGEDYCQAFKWTAEGGVVNLCENLPAAEAFPEAMNDLGQITGIADFGEGPEVFLWTPTSGVSGLEAVNGVPYAINNSEQILFGITVSVSENPPAISGYGLLLEEGEITVLNDYEQLSVMWSFLNNRSEAIGYLSKIWNEDLGAFEHTAEVAYWSAETGTINLNDCLIGQDSFSLETLRDFNDRGEVLAQTDFVYWLASPVPEPSTLSLLLIVYVAIAIKRFEFTLRKRSQNTSTEGVH